MPLLTSVLRASLLLSFVRVPRQSPPPPQKSIEIVPPSSSSLCLGRLPPGVERIIGLRPVRSFGGQIVGAAHCVFDARATQLRQLALPSSSAASSGPAAAAAAAARVRSNSISAIAAAAAAAAAVLCE